MVLDSKQSGNQVSSEYLDGACCEASGTVQGLFCALRPHFNLRPLKTEWSQVGKGSGHRTLLDFPTMFRIALYYVCTTFPPALLVLVQIEFFFKCKRGQRQNHCWLAETAHDNYNTPIPTTQLQLNVAY